MLEKMNKALHYLEMDELNLANLSSIAHPNPGLGCAIELKFDELSSSISKYRLFIHKGDCDRKA